MAENQVAGTVGVERRKNVRLQRACCPYLLSLPALLVCIGILIPFVTAIIYSMQRYNLAFPDMRAFIWFGNFVDLATDPTFWHTVVVSLEYTLLTVGVELLLGLGIALLLVKRNWVNDTISVLLILPLMVAPAIAALMWKLMTNPNFGVMSYLVEPDRLPRLQVGLGARARPCSRWSWSTPGSTPPSSPSCCWPACGRCPSRPSRPPSWTACRRLFVFFRVTLPMLTPYILTATLFRMLDSMQHVRHHLLDDAGRPGRHPDRLPGAGLPRGLQLHQHRAVGGAGDRPVGDHLRGVDHLHQELAQAPRQGARRAPSPGAATHGQGTLPQAAPGRGAPGHRPLLPVPHVLGAADVLPDQPGHPAFAARASSSRPRSRTTSRSSAGRSRPRSAPCPSTT